MNNIKNKSFGVIGGDKRQLYMAKSLSDDGFKVNLGGFDNLISLGSLKIETPIKAVKESDIIILPVPCVVEGKIDCAFSKVKIELCKELIESMKGKKIFCGMKKRLLNFAPQLNGDYIYDYLEREEFAVLNAVPTAEGAIEIAMREFEGTINQSRILVCGYGRIGKVLSDMLTGLGADVYVSARKNSDLAWLKTKGRKFLKTSELINAPKFDIIFNTVPTLIFDSMLLAKIAENALVIDLASYPGGVDFDAAKRLNIDTIHALSLPGKAAPKTAGETIKQTIYNMLEEDNR